MENPNKPPRNTGDRGQRYEVRAEWANGRPRERVVGFFDDRDRAVLAATAAQNSPGCEGTLIVDREEKASANTASIGHNQGPTDEEETITHLAAINPEALLVLPPDQFAALFELHYPLLVGRGRELEEGCRRWIGAHLKERGIAIADDSDNDATSDFLRQLATFAGDKGEVETTRRAVKRPVFDAGKAIDGWFGSLVDTIKAAAEKMNAAQTVYLRAKAARERAAREASEAAARQAEREAAERARKAAEEEARVAARAATGQASAQDLVRATQAADQAQNAALVAEEQAEAVASSSAAPDRDLVRSRSALGTTTSLQNNWQFEIVDMRELCRAVADGKVAPQFVQPAESVIRAAVRARHAPLRECPGLRIWNDQKARRSAA